MPVFGPVSIGYTLNDLIAETRRHLLSGQTEERNRLAAGYSPPAAGQLGTLTFQFPLKSIVAGAVIAVDLELFYVYTVDPVGLTAQVDGAQQGSVAATHASGATVNVRPKFSDFAIARAINQDMADLTAAQNGLFAAVTVPIVYSAQTVAYDLAAAADVIDLLEIVYETFAVNQFTPKVRGARIIRNANPAIFPSGFAVSLEETGAVQGKPMRVTYSTRFANLVNLSDDAQTVGLLPPTCNDIPPLGAAIRLVAPREIKRNFSEAQPDPRRAEEVPPGAVAQSTKGLMLLRQQRIASEASRLHRQWPQTLRRF